MAEQQPQIEKSFNILKPGGNPEVLRKCAEAWRDMAHDLQAAGRDLDQQVKDLSRADWDGQAATAFHEHWTHTKQRIDHALPNFERVAKELDQAANHIEDTNTQVEHVLEELAVTAAVGLGLTIITAGFSDAVAAGAAATEVAEAGTVVARLGSLLKSIESALETVKGLMEANKFAEIGVEFGTNVAGNFTGNVLGQKLSGQDVDLGQDFLDATVAGGAGTALGAAGRAVGGRMSGALGKVVEGDGFWGKTAHGAIASAGGQMAADGVDIPLHLGGKTTDSIIPDLITSAGGGAAGGMAVHGGEARYDHGGGGRHRAPDTGPTFGPGRTAGASGTVYGDANANENDIAARRKSPFEEPRSALTNPDGAYEAQGDS
ncbi:WXG100 family type VII secretion target [Streptomyces sp. 2224.1]|uniref:WXG100 family type VII secretion target n=1 Tax=Streptomyces sp. 2224.1 TaxID=1881020 RepID=UPI000898D2A9|nr:WXG100 family type VII secretion target [Streptomyces sp. 2224.1]SEC62479.1 WXG100 family type VII secretion target [Streptomyces sp. 2224.1]